MINYHSYVKSSSIYGPGKRFVLWVQGCKIQCKGCWNSEMWSLATNKLISPIDLANLVKTSSGIEGVTILGGEPMHQATDLLEFVRLLKQSGLSIFLYTGYEVEELIHPDQFELFSISDIVITGRYIDELRNTHLQWRGSSNQEIHIHGNVYKDVIIDDANYCEITITKDGETMILGYPTDEIIETIK